MPRIAKSVVWQVQLYKGLLSKFPDGCLTGQLVYVQFCLICDDLLLQWPGTHDDHG